MAFCVVLGQGFQIAKVEPKTVVVKEEQPRNLITLSCITDDWWQSCNFFHKGQKVCEIEHDSDTNYETKVKHCNENVKYVGDYKHYKCAIKLYHIGMEHDGEWTCELEDYDNHGSFERESMKINFIPIPTTTTTTTTTSTTDVEPTLKPRIVSSSSKVTNHFANVFVLAFVIIFVRIN